MSKTALTREKVLTKAMEIAHEKGISGLTYNGLARSLSVKPQSLYRLTPNIKDVKSQVMSKYLAHVSNTLITEMQDLEGIEALKALAIKFINLVEEDSKNSLKVSDILIGLADYGNTEIVTETMQEIRELIFSIMKTVSANPDDYHLNSALFFDFIIGYISFISTNIQYNNSKELFEKNIDRILEMIK